LAATLLALALPAPAFAAADQPNDPFFPPLAGWQTKIGWTPPQSTVAYPVIAIVDSGLWSGFDDFAGYLDDESADCTGPGSAHRMLHPGDVNDLNGHGTKVATLAAAPANGKGSVGVSPNSHVIVVRFTLRNQNDFGFVCAFNYLAGIAKVQPLVVNVSSAFDRAPPGAPKALDGLIKAGALVVAAAGNGNGKVQWPANAAHVLAVGLDNGDGARGRDLDLVAPGSNLLLPDLNGKWALGTGTSFSSPIVAGAAARVWGPLAVDEPQVITYLLRRFAKPTAKRDGFGLVKIDSALAGAEKLPVIEDQEPNDKQSTAFAKAGCTRTCTLQGLVTTTDDKFDYWRLSGRGTCPKKKRLPATGGVDAFCFRASGRGGGTFVKVTAKRKLGLYAVSVPRR
jgi:hypothetical protein